VTIEKGVVSFPFENRTDITFAHSNFALVNTTPLLKYHIIFLILSGIFRLHRVLLCTTLVSEINTLYIDLMEKVPFWWRPRINESDAPFSLVCATNATKSCHNLRLLPTKPIRSDTFSGMELKIVATETFFLHTIAYNEGKCY
jgi:hypothetical protein